MNKLLETEEIKNRIQNERPNLNLKELKKNQEELTPNRSHLNFTSPDFFFYSVIITVAN